MIDCVVGFSLDDRREHLVGFLRRLAPMLTVHRTAQWGIDLRECDYLGPFASAVIAALWQDATKAGAAPGIGLPKSPPELLGYFWFSGLEKLLRNGREPDVGHPLCETVPLRTVATSAFNDPDPLISLIRRHHAISADVEDSLRTCVNETLQNVQDHSASPVGGVYTARFLRQRGEVRVAVVDTGVGIASTLRGRYPGIRTDDQALRAVLQGEHTARSTERNLGVGISTMARIVRGCGGSFILLSGNAMREVTPDGRASDRETLPVPFPGTGVFFTFPELKSDDDDDDADERT